MRKHHFAWKHTQMVTQQKSKGEVIRVVRIEVVVSKKDREVLPVF